MELAAAAIALALLAWGIVIYNRLVRDRHRVAQAWSDVDVQLKRRHDLIPKLVDAVKQHAGYERGLLERLARLRGEAAAGEASPGGRGRVEGALTEVLHRLLAVAEAYPELKASQSFLDLQRNLSAAEDQIQFARRYYNGAVNNLNTRIDTFPDLLVARALGYRHAEYFELDQPGEAAPPELA
jgi:LemA protein